MSLEWYKIHWTATRWYCLLLLLVHCALLAYGSYSHSPGFDESGHLSAGLSHWQSGRFAFYHVNPPLVRMAAALPVTWCDPKTDWEVPQDTGQSRPEWIASVYFLEANKRRIRWLFSVARWACIPFSLVGASVCFLWAKDLYGELAGIVAITLWCVSPNILAHGQMLTPDTGAAAIGVAAGYLFWRWLKESRWALAMLVGLVLGMAELTKASWIVLFGLWPIVWVIWRWPRQQRRDRQPTTQEQGPLRCNEASPGSAVRSSLQLAMILLAGLFVINLGYGCEGSCQRLGDYRFRSSSLKGSDENGGSYGPATQNRFVGTCLAGVPVPLPKHYVLGIDRQKKDFERKTWSYLRGEWRMGGWWYYYLYALVVKVPLGTWVLIGLTFFCGVCLRGYSATWRDELVLLAPIVVVLTLVSSQTGFNHHLRYVLPIFPFAFIWMSKVARAFEFGHRKLAAVVAMALTWSVGSSLWVYPHSLSYFNELVGGPKNGPAHLLNSNIDWGQDLLYLKSWLDEHPEVKLDGLAFFGSYPATVAGIPKTPYPPPGALSANFTAVDCRAANQLGPRPGWYAVSVNYIFGRDQQYRYFLEFEPVATAGYSIYIYHVTLDEANRVRRELGLPDITAKDVTARSMEPESGRDGG